MQALFRKVTFPSCRLAPAVKRIIGKQYEDVEQDVGQLSYRVADDGYGSVVLECPQLAAAAAAARDGGEGSDAGDDTSGEDDWQGEGAGQARSGGRTSAGWDDPAVLLELATTASPASSPMLPPTSSWLSRASRIGHAPMEHFASCFPVR